MIGITQRELLLEMREDIRGLKATVDAIARDQALGIERRAAGVRVWAETNPSAADACGCQIGCQWLTARTSDGRRAAQVVLGSLARPEGSEHALQTFVVEGVDELVKALLAA